MAIMVDPSTYSAGQHLLTRDKLCGLTDPCKVYSNVYNSHDCIIDLESVINTSVC